MLVDRPLKLDRYELVALPNPKIYCKGIVEIDTDVDADALGSELESLVTPELVLCPCGLGEVISRKCNQLETRVILYDGELWMVDDDPELDPTRFDFMDGIATVVVTGDLYIDPEIEPQVLADKLAKIHNLGVIHCTKAQMGAIQARMGLNEGAIIDSANQIAPANGGNVGYLIL